MAPANDALIDNRVDRITHTVGAQQILAAAKPLSGQADQTAKTISGTVNGIDGNVGSGNILAAVKNIQASAKSSENNAERLP